MPAKGKGRTFAGRRPPPAGKGLLVVREGFLARGKGSPVAGRRLVTRGKGLPLAGRHPLAMRKRSPITSKGLPGGMKGPILAE